MFSSTVRTLRPLALAAAVLSLMAAPICAQTSQVVAVPNRIVQPVDESARVTLHGYVSPLANASTDRGAASDSMPMDGLHLVLKRSASQEATLRQMIAGMNQPGSPYYHKWLTPAQFGQQFGPSDQDVATVESWLSSHGFSVTGVKPGRQVIEFSGNVAQLRSAFGVQIHKYQVNGNVHYATATEPQIPAALSPVVGGFVSLNNFRPVSYAKVLGQATYDPKTHAVQPNWNYGSSSNPFYVVSPQDFGVEYDLPNSTLNPGYSGTNYDGSGETIAIVNEANINIDLVNQFRSLFLPGYPANPPTVIIDGNDPGIDGINNLDGMNYASDEAYIDVEWAGAVAPMAHVDLVIAADTALESGLFLAAEHAVYSDVAPIMSLSFGACESGLGSTNAYIDALMEQAAAEGITVMVSTGDSGSAGCDNPNSQEYAVYGTQVSGFASTPWNVAVGGTDFYYSGWASGAASIVPYWTGAPTTSQNPAETLKGYIQEQPWNGSQFGDDVFNYYQMYGGATSIAGGSGGASSAALCSTGYSRTTGACGGTLSGYPKPAWQTGFGTDKVRDLPDVSLFASSGANYSFYPFCYADGDCQTGSNPIQISGAGGTSFAAPAFAGIMALVDEANGGPQGQADTVLYPLKTQYPAAFHDITVGTNAVPCNLTTVGSGAAAQPPLDCITAPSGLGYQVTDPTFGPATEGELGSGTTPSYKAAAGYNLATGLGSVDAAQLVADWSKVSFKSTTMTLTPGSTSFTHGTAVTISGAVGGGSGTYSGNVALMTDSTEPGNQGVGFAQVYDGGPSTFAVAGSGSFSGSVNDLPGGTYNVWGSYSGDSANAASTSSKTQITVSPENSNVYFSVLNSSGGTGITSGNTTITYGTQGTLSAQVVPSSFYTTCVTPASPPASCNTTTFTPPTGTVTYTDNGTAINTAVMNAEGDAEFNAPFSIGTHSLSASYTGDNSYNKSSTSSNYTFTVVQDQPDLYAGASNSSSTSNTVIGGQATNFYVLVENSSNDSIYSSTQYPSITGVAAPTGTVTVTGLPQGTQTATLVAEVDPATGSPDGVAEFTIAAATTGSLTLGVSYSGDKNYTALAAQSAQIAIQAPTLLKTTMTVQMSGSITPNSSITVTGTVTGQSGHPAPTGDVYVYPDGDPSTFFTLVPGTGDSSTFSGTITSQVLFQGGNIVTLQYTGDNTYNGSSALLNSGTPISTPDSDFSLTAASSIVSASASGSGTTTVYVTPTNGFSGAVGLGCAVAGSPTGVTCSLSQSSVTLAASSTAKLDPHAHGLDLLLTGGGGVLACVLLLGMPARRRAWRNVLSLVLFACIIGFGAGCGGSSGSGNIGPIGGGGGTGGSGSGTPGTVVNPSQSVTLTVTTSGATAGNYAVVITGTSSSTNQIHTLGVTAAVQ